MRVIHGSVLVMSRREPSAEDVDELAVWCGGCARFLGVRLPHQTADDVLALHLEQVHGQTAMWPLDGDRFTGPEWDDFGGIGA